MRAGAQPALAGTASLVAKACRSCRCDAYELWLFTRTCIPPLCPPLPTYTTCLDALQAEDGLLEGRICAEEEQLDLSQLRPALLGTLQQFEMQRPRAWLQQSKLENEQLGWSCTKGSRRCRCSSLRSSYLRRSF